MSRGGRLEGSGGAEQGGISPKRLGHLPLPTSVCSTCSLRRRARWEIGLWREDGTGPEPALPADPWSPPEKLLLGPAGLGINGVRVSVGWACPAAYSHPSDSGLLVKPGLPLASLAFCLWTPPLILNQEQAQFIQGLSLVPSLCPQGCQGCPIGEP